MQCRHLLPLLLAALTFLPAEVSAGETATPQAVVQADLDALNRNDLDAFMALYAPHAQIFGLPKDPHRLAGPRLEQMYGTDKLRAFFAKAMAEPVTPHIETTASFVLGDLLLGKVRITDPRQPEPQVMMVAYRVRDGLIQHLWHLGKETDANRAQSPGALRVAQALVEANNRADVDALLALFAPDARHFSLSSDPDRLAEQASTALTDAASRERAFRTRHAQRPGPQVQLLASFAVGDLAATHERVRHPAGEVEERLSVLRVRDGRVLDLWPLQRTTLQRAVAAQQRAP